MPSSDASTLQILPTEEGNEPKFCGCPVPRSGHLPLRPLLEWASPLSPQGPLWGCHGRWSCATGLAPDTYKHSCFWERGIIRLVQRSQSRFIWGGRFSWRDKLYFSGGDYPAHQLCCRGQSLSSCWSYKSSPGSSYLLLRCQPKGQHAGRVIPK